MRRTARVTPIIDISGWVSVGLMAFSFVALYLVNYKSSQKYHVTLRERSPWRRPPGQVYATEESRTFDV